MSVSFDYDIAKDAADKQPDMEVKLKDGTVMKAGLMVPKDGPRVSFLASPPEIIFPFDELKAWAKKTVRTSMIERCSPVHQQGRCSSCAPYALMGLVELVRELRGHDKVRFQPEHLYQNVNKNSRGQHEDRGSLLDHCQKGYLEFGCSLEAKEMYQKFSMDHLSFEIKRALNQQAFDYRGLDFSTCPIGNPEVTYQHMICNVIRGNPCLAGIHCDQAFFDAASDGTFQPARGRNDVGNHGIGIIDVIIDSILQGRSYRDIRVRFRNSHGDRWANGGYAEAGFDHFEKPMQFHQTCPVVSVRMAPDEPINSLLN